MRHLAAVVSAAAVVAIALVLATPERAEACGGCLSPVDSVTTVDSHRMIVALGAEETVLWDQILYSGDPEDFVWVLPVPSPDVEVELAAPELFDWIDAATSPVVGPARPLRTSCPSSGGDGDGEYRGDGFGCGGAEYYPAGDGDGDGDGDGADAGAPAVEVTNRETVGPYETVTITSEDPMALYEWLQDNGYLVTEEARPAIDDYVEAGASFVALRLAPGEGVSAMQPIRIRYPSFMGTFPLKMVVVGARGVLSLSLWIVAEQRYEAYNYGTVEIDESRLIWDWADRSSNYNELFRQTAIESGNRAWIAEYADMLASVGFGFNYTPPPAEAAEDLEIANTLVPDAFVTRLRTEVLVDHVDEDMILAPSADASWISGFLTAQLETNRPPEPDCSGNGGFAAFREDGGVACRSGDSHRATASMLLLLVAVFFGFRRRRRCRINRR